MVTRFCPSWQRKEKGHLFKLTSCFWQMGEKTDFPIRASSRLPLAQSNPYANMVYLGVAYPGTLQKQS